MIHTRTFEALKLGLAVLTLSMLAVLGAAALEPQRMDPPSGQTLARPPQHLRVFFDVLPDPAKSELELTGPGGEVQLEGLHTMGEDDLMIRIVGRLPDGEYTARWRATGTDGSTNQGEWKFVVKRGG